MDNFFILYGLTLIGVVITFLAEVFVTSSYKKYGKISNKRGMTGREAARYLLDKNGLSDIKIERTSGFLTDHYDPINKVIRLSKTNYDEASIASVAVACHECGHAIQDKEGYFFLRFRNMLIPVVNFSSKFGYFAIVFGCLFASFSLVWLGIILEMVIDASRRALKELDYAHFFTSQELDDGKVMLTAAALTYVASILTTLLELIRLIMIFGRRDD